MAVWVRFGFQLGSLEKKCSGLRGKPCNGYGTIVYYQNIKKLQNLTKTDKNALTRIASQWVSHSNSNPHQKFLRKTFSPRGSDGFQNELSFQLLLSLMTENGDFK